MARIKPKIRSEESPTLKHAAHAAIAWKKEGDVALNAMAQTQHELGMEYARSRVETLTERNASTAGAIYEKLLQDMSVEHTVIRDTGERFVVHSRNCPFLREWEKEDVETMKLCEYFGNSFIRGLCEGINPDLKFSVTRMMSRGDTYCEEIIELIPRK